MVPLKMSSRTRRGLDERGQSSVEAALLLPSVMLLLALLMQPVCLAYTRSVMETAACGAARVLLTARGDDKVAREFALRRLEAVPEVSVFHVGGRDDWNLTLSCEGRTASVEIEGHARPLPLLGIVASSFGRSDSAGVVLDVSVEEQMRPEWLGGDYASWTSVWG